MNRLFFILFAAIFSISAFSQTSLKELIVKKTSNYSVLKTHYTQLLASVRSNNSDQFCKQVEDSYQILVSILEDDSKLINELRRVNNPDYQDYATQLDENIASPLFSYGAYMDLCQNSDRSNIIKLRQSMEYHVTNIDYLTMIHLMWIEGFENGSL